MERRHYPPAVVVHLPQCREGSSLPAIATRALLDEFYSHRFDFCFQEAGFNLGELTAGLLLFDGTAPMVTIERQEYKEHPYTEGSGDKPRDAIRERCKVCLGTHGSDEREVITLAEQRPADTGTEP